MIYLTMKNNFAIINLLFFDVAINYNIKNYKNKYKSYTNIFIVAYNYIQFY
jgi:hypothetical protein